MLLNSSRKRLVGGVIGILLIAGATAIGWSALRWWAVPVLPVSILGFSLGERLGNLVRSWALALAEIWGYVKSMGPPIGAFALGYLVLTYVFATIFAAVWRADHSALKGISDHPNLSDFAYYSVITISTVGYGDVYPNSPTSKLLAAFEILSGTAWTLVVFAAAITLVQKRLERSSRSGETAKPKSQDDNSEIQERL